MFYIFTQNKFNQVLIFDSKEKAVAWCKAAAVWTDKEIEENIKIPVSGNGFLSIYEN